MSVLNNFSLPKISGNDLSDSRKVKAVLDALRMMDENMRYAMYNMDPEDNFSDTALKTYKGLISKAEKLGEDGKKYLTLIEQNAEAIKLEAERATGEEVELAAALSITAEGLLSKVEKGSVISAINQSAEEISIEAAKINLNGAVTANNYFRINTDGSVETSAITIGGKNSKINIQTSSTTYDVIALNYADDNHVLLAGMKPGEVRAEFDNLVAVMDGADGFVYHSADGGIDAQYAENAYTKGYGDFRRGVFIGAKAGIATRYGDSVIVQDYGNGTIGVEGAGDELLLGNTGRTSDVRIPIPNLYIGRVGELDTPHSMYAEGEIVADGTITTFTDLQNYSLKSLKTNITPYKGEALEDVRRAKVFEYEYKSNVRKGIRHKSYGFVIGEGEPEKVLGENKKTVSLYSAIGILWKAVQELDERVKK